MFTVIYSFKVKGNQSEVFEKAWKELTLLIYEFEGSMGSRLHKSAENNYIGYAQWPDKNTWENSGNHLPEIATEIRKTMKSACTSIEVLHELEVVDDLLEKVSYSKR